MPSSPVPCRHVVQLNEKQFALRHVKEKSEAAQELVQRIESGLSHIGDLLGVEKREEDQTSSVGDLLRDIETALDTVLDEREKQLQQQAGQQTGQVSSGGSPALLAIPGTESLRSPFSRANTSQYEANRGHLDMGFDVTKSFSKARGQKKRAKGGDHPQKTKSSSPRDSDDEVRHVLNCKCAVLFFVVRYRTLPSCVISCPSPRHCVIVVQDEQDEPMDRTFLKTVSLKSVKDAEKRAAKAAKDKKDAELAAMK